MADPSGHGEQAVRVLLLEDDAEDAALLQAQLRQSGLPMQFELVGDEAQYLAALDRGLPDIVLADYRLRGYSGLDALRELRRRDPQLPFILVSGTLRRLLRSWGVGLHPERPPRAPSAGGASRARRVPAAYRECARRRGAPPGAEDGSHRAAGRRHRP